jgi:hypothetical protein
MPDDPDEIEQMLLRHRELAVVTNDRNMVETIDILMMIREEWNAQGRPAYWPNSAHGGKSWLN